MAIFYSVSEPGKGTLGNNYLRRSKDANGKTINVLATKNFSPHNPRTYLQMNQRAKFATAVKFYKRATRNFFKFAYEDKRANESDYNAFMRHNVSAAVPMIKYQVDSEAYPALGDPWLLSQGSILPVKFVVSDGSVGIDIAAAAAPTTIADISKAFIAVGYEIGDIATFVVVQSACAVSDINAYSKDQVDSHASELGDVPTWSISQFIIDPNNDDPIEDIKFTGRVNAWSQVTVADGKLQVEGLNEDGMLAAAIIITRIVGSKLKASTTYLEGNEVYDNMLKAADTSDYAEAAMLSWNAKSSDAILKGSIAGGNTRGTAVNVPKITSVNGKAIPLTDWPPTDGEDNAVFNLSGQNFIDDSGTLLKQSDFTTNNAIISVKSLAVTDKNNAVLVVKGDISTHTGTYNVLYQNSVIVSVNQGDI